MSIPLAPEPALRPTGTRALRVRFAVTVAAVLTLLRPNALRRVLTQVARGARPSSTAEAAAARAAVCAVSARCAGLGCLQRSIAVHLLCRSDGHAPSWRTGFRLEPFVAHAWVEVDGAPVAEPPDVASYCTVLEVAAPRRSSDESPLRPA